MLVEAKKDYEGPLAPVFERAIFLFGTDGFQVEPAEELALAFRRGGARAQRILSGCVRLKLGRRAESLRLAAEFPAEKWVGFALVVLGVIITCAIFNEHPVWFALLASLFSWVLGGLVFLGIRTLVWMEHERELKRLLHNLSAELPRQQSSRSLKLAPSRALEPRRCAYCHDDDAGALLPLCPGCGAALHPECWVEAGSCPSLGCRGGRGRRLRVRGGA